MDAPARGTRTTPYVPRHSADAPRGRYTPKHCRPDPRGRFVSAIALPTAVVTAGVVGIAAVTVGAVRSTTQADVASAQHLDPAIPSYLLGLVADANDGPGGPDTIAVVTPTIVTAAYTPPLRTIATSSARGPRPPVGNAPLPGAAMTPLLASTGGATVQAWTPPGTSSPNAPRTQPAPTTGGTTTASAPQSPTTTTSSASGPAAPTTTPPQAPAPQASPDPSTSSEPPAPAPSPTVPVPSPSDPSVPPVVDPSPVVTSPSDPAPSTSSPDPQPSATPADPNAMPVGNLAGWTQVFADDFTRDAPLGSFLSTYGDTWTAYPYPWPDTSTHGTYDPDRTLSVANSALDVYVHTENGTHYVAAPAPKLPKMTYGRYSVRFRADQVPGYKTAWLLWPDDGSWPAHGEVDFPEGNLDSTISAFAHYADVNGGQDAFPTSADYSSWHTATVEWSPGRLVFILDGNVIGTSTHEVPDTPMHWVLQTETQLSGGAPSDGAAGHVQIDWVTAYTYTP